MTKKELEDVIKAHVDAHKILLLQINTKDHEINDLIRSKARKDLKIADLKDDLKQEELCYQLAASRAKHFKSQLAIIKETLSLKETT